MITRLARPEDHEPALEVWRASRAAKGQRPSKEVVARVAEKIAHGLLVVGEEDGRLVGLALGEQGRDDPELLHLEMVIVHPDAEGRGLGGTMVEAIADEGWDRGFRNAEVWCSAPGFYEAAGFERSAKPPVGDRVHLVAELEAPVRDVPVSGEIRLGQFLKLAEMVESGSEAKARIAAGEVVVNDEPETRRGRQLHDGDVVRTTELAARVRLTS